MFFTDDVLFPSGLFTEQAPFFCHILSEDDPRRLIRQNFLAPQLIVLKGTSLDTPAGAFGSVGALDTVRGTGVADALHEDDGAPELSGRKNP
jgi:hypothetical protein